MTEPAETISTTSLASAQSRSLQFRAAAETESNKYEVTETATVANGSGY